MTFKKISCMLKKLLKKFDLFPTDQFVRYNKDTQYTTATGGFISVAVIIAILILFSSKGIQVLDRSVITSTVSTSIEADPTPIKVMASPEGRFMFSIGMFGLKLTNPLVTYFNVSLTQSYYSPVYKLINQTSIPLIQCTPAHYNFNPQVLHMFDRLNMADSLCPPLGYTFQVGGRFNSEVYSQFSIGIQKCNSNKTSNCANQAFMSSIGSFILTVPIVNTIVNPNDKEYLQTYIEDRNFFSFSTTNGIMVKGEISQLKIDTDVSIMPNENIISQTINSVPNLLDSSNIAVRNNAYCSISFSKSRAITTYSRSFSKLDNFVSYIGGFVGAALVLFFLLKSYSEKAFLIEVGAHLFRDEDDNCTLARFSFFDNIGVGIKGVLNALQITLNWPRGEFLTKAMEKVQTQIDVALLLRRIAFLQEAVNVLFTPHQINALHLASKRLLHEAQDKKNKQLLMQVMESLEQGQDFQQKCKEEIEQQCQANLNQSFLKMKADVHLILQEAQTKDVLSKRIIQKMSPKLLKKLGLNAIANNQIIQVKQSLSQQQICSSFSNHKLNFEQGSKDNMFIESQVESKPIEKQDFVFQYIQN